MKKNEITKKLYSNIDEIPTLPAVVPRLLSLFEQEDVTARKVAELISEDPALTANVLKVANSAYYGFSGRISTVEHAVMLLGFNMVRALTLSVGVIKTLPSRETAFSEEALWLHSIRVATSMDEIAKHYHMTSEKKGYIFIIGLLHDIGKILFDQLFPEEYQKLFADEPDLDTGVLAEREREIFGVDHAEAGALLLKRWHFPEVIWFPIETHHMESLPQGVDNTLVSLLRLSDRVSLNYDSPENLCPEDCKAELKVLNIDESVLFNTAHALSEAEDRIRAFYASLQ